MKKIINVSIGLILVCLLIVGFLFLKYINKPYMITKSIDESCIYQLQFSDDDYDVSIDFTEEVFDNERGKQLLEIIYDNIFTKGIFIDDSVKSKDYLCIKVSNKSTVTNEKVCSSFTITIYENGYVYIEVFEDVGLKTGYYKFIKSDNQLFEKLKSECYELVKLTEY